ncbi:MAG: hypothetical protein PHE59_05090, partial [Patescibacteria group bacterium]|nr:hypothetical protein [Patescibacteria group bacterium]
MPIEGFAADRIERLGKIRLGIRVPSTKDPTKTYPRATEYFVVPPEVQKVHGEKPTELPIMFPTPDPAEWLSHYYRCYSQSFGLICIGNGIKANQKTDMSTGAIVDRDTKEGNWEWREITCEGEECPYFEKKTCRGMMFLNVILPKVPGIGVYQLVTSSRHSRMNILSMINTLQKMASRVNATIDFVPFTLRLEPQTANPVGGKQKTIHVVHIRAEDLKIEDFIRLATSRSMRERLRLAAPAAQTPEEAAKEELPEDLELPLDEPSEEDTSKGKGKPAAEKGKDKPADKPADKKKPERVKQVDAEKMVVDFFGHDGWDKFAVPGMKVKFNVESWDQLT